MTGLIVQLSYSKIAEKEPQVSILSKCFFITKNIIACYSNSVRLGNMNPVKHTKYIENFIIIGTYIIPFTTENMYEYPDYNITLLVLNKSYDVEIPKMSKSSAHTDTQVFFESFRNELHNLAFKLSWAGKKLNILEHNLDKFYVRMDGLACETVNVYFGDSESKRFDEKELMKGTPLEALTMTFKNKNESDEGSPVYNPKTNEFLGMIIRCEKSADGKSYEYFAVSSIEFIKLMKKQGIIKKGIIIKKHWYKFWK